MKRRTAIMISGRGSNMEALIKAANRPTFPAQIDLVISNNPDALGLEFAKNAGIHTEVVDHRPFGQNKESHEREIDKLLRERDIEIICLAGYMRLLTASFVNAWEGRILNIHPSLLPAFPGLNTHARALEAKVKYHGCTVHIVTPEMDCGPILAQSEVHVYPDDTEETLAQRVLAQEHGIYSIVLYAFASNLLKET